MMTKHSAQGAAEKLLDNPGLSVERLPMLSLIFDRLAAACAEGLRPYSPAVLTCFVNSIATDHVWNVLEAYDGSVAAILYSPELDARVLIGLERRCIFSLMEVFLGGDGKEPWRDEARDFSAIEVRVAETVFEIAAGALHSAFGPVIATGFELERVETRLDSTVMGRRNVAAVVGKILIQAADAGGQMFVVIPQPTLAPIRQQLSRDVSSDGSASDAHWQKMMRRRVEKTEVTAVAILDEVDLTLGEISGWRVGDVLTLKPSAANTLRLDCKDEPLFWCELGQAQGHYTLKIADRVDTTETPLARFLELACAEQA